MTNKGCCDPEKIRAMKQRYYRRHREEVLAANRRYYREHREQWLTNVKAWCDRHPGYAAEKARNWRAKQRERIV